MSVIDRIPLRNIRCTRCRKGPDACRCWQTCWCGTSRLRTEVRCPNPEHAYSRQSRCCCALPEASRRECMAKSGNRTPCRCACHLLHVKGQSR